MLPWRKCFWQFPESRELCPRIFSSTLSTFSRASSNSLASRCARLFGRAAARPRERGPRSHRPALSQTSGSAWTVHVFSRSLHARSEQFFGWAQSAGSFHRWPRRARARPRRLSGSTFAGAPVAAACFLESMYISNRVFGEAENLTRCRIVGVIPGTPHRPSSMCPILLFFV